MNEESEDDGYTFELKQPSRGITGLDAILNFGNYHASNDALPSRRTSEDDLDELFAGEANFDHDFELPTYEPNFGKRESCGPLAQYVWTPTIPKLAQKQPVQRVPEQRVVKHATSPFASNSNKRPIDLNTNFSSHLPFVKVSVNYPNEPAEPTNSKVAVPEPQLDDCKLAKAKSQRTEATDQIEFDEGNDATVTTECSDGPGCRVPWLRKKDDKISSGLPQKLTPSKSVRSKRIIKAGKITASGPKRAYKKKADQPAHDADDDAIKSRNKSSNQESAAKPLQNNNCSSIKTELAPPFAGNTSAPADSPDTAEGSETKDTYRQKLNRYWKKKYSVKTKRHIYKARQQVAERRLRIEGRFVTKKQAYEILGMDESSLYNADTIQELLTAHANDKKKINSNI